MIMQRLYELINHTLMRLRVVKRDEAATFSEKYRYLYRDYTE